ncbi:MAG: DUF4112 domain-containing protein [Acidobacteriales bacterium]|nr:DUF4112 domain-containing protein [Terriglobales bacterium]
MGAPLEPEVFPPGTEPPPRKSERVPDEFLELLVRILDDMFAIPGTRLRFGLDPVLGLIPGLGDVAASLFSFLVVFAAWERRVPKVTMARMIVNIAIDSVVGAVPVAGDVFDVAWKSNRRNYDLLRRMDTARTRRHEIKDWLFLGACLFVVMVIVAAPLVVIWLLLRWLLGG